MCSGVEPGANGKLDLVLVVAQALDFGSRGPAVLDAMEISHSSRGRQLTDKHQHDGQTNRRTSR